MHPFNKENVKYEIIFHKDIFEEGFWSVSLYKMACVCLILDLQSLTKRIWFLRAFIYSADQLTQGKVIIPLEYWDYKPFIRCDVTYLSIE